MTKNVAIIPVILALAVGLAALCGFATLKSEAKAALLESRLAALEKRVADSEPKIIPVDPAEQAREKELGIFTLRTVLTRQVVRRVVDEYFVRRARTFLELTDAREKAGQVTKLDVFNADCQLRCYELAIVHTQRLLEEAKADLIEANGESVVEAPDLLFAVPEYRTEGVRIEPVDRTELVVDESKGTVALATSKSDKVISTKPVFQATHIQDDALKSAIEKAPATERPRYQRKVESAARLLRTYEIEVLVRAKQIEASRRSVEAAQVSFDRGLKDSFDVIRAEESLDFAEHSFIDRVMDYNIQLAQLNALLARGH
jgi:hypothetical protein